MTDKEKQSASVVIPGYWSLSTENKRKIDNVLKAMTKERQDSERSVPKESWSSEEWFEQL